MITDYYVIPKLLQRAPNPLFWMYYINEKRKFAHTNKTDSILFSISKGMQEINRICNVYPLVR